MRLTIKSIRQKKRKKEKIVVLTAYDYPFARILDETGMDIVLVGDSLGIYFQLKAASRAEQIAEENRRRQERKEQRRDIEDRRRFGVQQRFAERQQGFVEREAELNRQEQTATGQRERGLFTRFNRPQLVQNLSRLNALKSGRQAFRTAAANLSQPSSLSSLAGGA